MMLGHRDKNVSKSLPYNLDDTELYLIGTEEPTSFAEAQKEIIWQHACNGRRIEVNHG